MLAAILIMIIIYQTLKRFKVFVPLIDFRHKGQQICVLLKRLLPYDLVLAKFCFFNMNYYCKNQVYCVSQPPLFHFFFDEIFINHYQRENQKGEKKQGMNFFFKCN